MRKRKWIVGLSSALMLSTFMFGCAKEEEPTQAEIQLEKNVSNAPKISKKTSALIKESRGEPLLDENGEVAETGEIVGSFSPGEQTQLTLSAMSKKQLMEQDKLIQINIFMNGVIRDEYIVAATTLYGEDTVKEYKEMFKNTLLSKEGEEPVEGEDSEPQTAIVDRIGTYTDLNDSNVANHFIDDIIEQMNRTYIQTLLENDFEEKVTITGGTYNISLSENLQALASSAAEFVQLSDSNYSYYTDEDIKALNEFYKDSFLESLTKSPIDIVTPVSGQIGGFVQNEEGLWLPSDMTRLAGNVLDLIYLN